MGADKSSRTVGGVAMGVRAGRALLQVSSPVLAVGPDPGLGLATVADGQTGPLGAMAAGMRHLQEDGFHGPVILLACDLPLVTPELLRLLAHALGDADAAVPIAGGRLQPLAACYSPRVLPVTAALMERGIRAMHSLLDGIDIHPVPAEEWGRVAGPEALEDIDTPEDLRAINARVVKVDSETA